MGACEPLIQKLVTEDAWKIVANQGLQISNVAKGNESKDKAGFEQDERLDEIEQQLDEVRDKIMDWEKDESMIWDRGPEEANEYLKVVNGAQKLTKSLENLSLNGCCPNALLLTAHDILQTAMGRLKEQFRHLLVQNRRPFQPQHVSEEDIVEASSIVSSGDDSVEPGVQRESMSKRSGTYVFELVHPDVIPILKSIANLMFESNYDQECSQMFINVQRDALDDCLSVIEVEKLSMEDVLKMEWNSLRQWMCAVKIFIRVYLTGEKLLSDQIFGEVGLAGSSCFVESSKPAVLQLLNFGKVMAIRLHQPENQFRILGMYVFLSDLIPHINTLYSDKTGNDVRTECHETLRRLGKSIRAILLEFENAVTSAVSANAPLGGDVHPLTRYVMNYIKILTEYGKTLNVLLKDKNREDSTLVSEDESVGRSSCASPMALHFRSLISIFECNLEEKSRMERDNSLRHLFLLDNIHNMTLSVGRSSSASPIAPHLQTLISNLELNLDEKSKMYRDKPLQHLFLMNNIHYIVEKVKNSELRAEVGDEWVHRQNWKFKHHALSYAQATWSSILVLFKDEGIRYPPRTILKDEGILYPSRTILKERLQSFNLAFKEVYKRQTGWLIPDGLLREDLQISTSVNVIQAYRSFLGRYANHISLKSVKYTPDDLQNYLFHLFEGAQKSLHD